MPGGDNTSAPDVPADPKKPAPSHVTMNTEISTDGQSLIIYLQNGQERYKSNPLPTLADTRSVMH